MAAARADVKLWDRKVGAVRWEAEGAFGVFEYYPEYVATGFEVAPLTVPLRTGPMDFRSLPRQTFHGLPGFLADSLPDRFGNQLINRWLAEQGRPAGDMDPVERLLYTGRRGMGALEFEPATGHVGEDWVPVDIAPLVELANRILNQRQALTGTLAGGDQSEALARILRVGTSAGGARAKAVLAWNEATGEFRSGQTGAPPGFSHWLLKFDGVSKSGDRGLADPKGYGRLEYACHLLATAAGVEMAPCRLHEEGGRAHFMTKRFDRTGTAATGEDEKLHMLSLGAMRHFDYNMAQAYSYEQALETIRMLGLGMPALEQMFRRAIVNVVIRNQDDHVKNTAFLMDRNGDWRLSPAYDIIHAHDPGHQWYHAHQMTLAGKSDSFDIDDLRQLGRMADIKPGKADAAVREVESAAARWDEFVAGAGVPDSLAAQARGNFRFFLSK